jgi:hypothetical protein
MWTVKPGTEEKVAELFANYVSPEHTVRGEDGEVKGKLLSTAVFMKDNVIVRVMEVEGDMAAVAAHLGAQPGIQALERQLDDYLEVPRDMSTPEGAAKFFRESAMRCLVARRAED